VRVLVATDIAARGIHVDGIDLVIHADPPSEHKAYLAPVRADRPGRCRGRGGHPAKPPHRRPTCVP
jgi:Superfamily II DNA and RNA helicases